MRAGLFSAIQKRMKWENAGREKNRGKPRNEGSFAAGSSPWPEHAHYFRSILASSLRREADDQSILNLKNPPVDPRRVVALDCPIFPNIFSISGHEKWDSFAILELHSEGDSAIHSRTTVAPDLAPSLWITGSEGLSAQLNHEFQQNTNCLSRSDNWNTAMKNFKKNLESLYFSWM